MNIGEGIKAQREKQNLSRRALSEKSRVPESSIEQYENGLCEPNANTLMCLAIALGVSFKTLYGWEYAGMAPDGSERYTYMGKEILEKSGHFETRTIIRSKQTHEVQET